MFYEEYKPSEYLESFIKCFWVMVQDDQQVSRAPEVVMPDGFPEIVFNLASPFQRHIGDRAEVQPPAIVVGQIKRCVLIQPTNSVDLFGVRFMPNGLYPLLKQSLGELTDKIEQVDTVLGKLGSETTGRICDAGTTFERIAAFEESVSGLFEKHKYGGLSARATDIILSCDGQLRIDELAKKLDTNWKTIERHFKREVGITPKLFCRITRLQKILQIINRTKAPNWTDIAYSFGYFDQAHFIKDFRGFSGVAPKTFLGRRNQISDSFVG